MEGPFSEASQQWTARDFRFTCKGDIIYAFQMAWPADRQALITSMRLTDSLHVTEVSLVGYEGVISWSQMADGLHIDLPPEPPCEAVHVFPYGCRQLSNSADIEKLCIDYCLPKRSSGSENLPGASL